MFNIKDIAVADEDILEIEALFGFALNDGQKKLLRFWDSVDIQACPGSGKTTTLAAKLIILAKKVPSAFQQGICVITHTNIAVEEIKEKLGPYARFYSRYPNHFGTIQSFVDKFLAIPRYKNEYKCSPNIVDVETYSREIYKSYSLKVNGTLNFLQRKSVELEYLSFNKFDFSVSKRVNLSAPFTISGLKPATMQTYYNRVAQAKLKLLAEGYLKYDEAYALAFQYLRENPKLNEILPKRFPLVFIDEMQDMELHQSELIELLFGGKKTSLQKIGDINQSIYSRSEAEDGSDWKPIINPELQLINSNRLADNIVKLVRDICMIPQEAMVGWDNQNPIKPAVIVYKTESIDTVKDTFAAHIVKLGLPQSGLYKCIGSRVGDNANLNINSYWSGFNRVKEKSEFKNLISYIYAVKKQLHNSKNLKDARKLFLEACCKGLRICKFKNPITGYYFTTYSLQQYLKATENEEKLKKFDFEISTWVTKLSFGVDILGDCKIFLTGLITFIGGTVTQDLNVFLASTDVEEKDEKNEMKVYSYDDGNMTINLHFDTIHGVKGETHTATLFLETFTRIFDIGDKIMEFIASNEKERVKHRKNGAMQKRLPLAYVALTRATHFVALAVNKDRFTENHERYFESKKHEWEVIYV